MSKVFAGTILLVAAWLSVTPARACPYCDSDLGRQVWAGIFNDAFWLHALLTLLPLLVLLAFVALLHFGPPRPRGWLAPDTRTHHEHRSP